MKKLMMKKLMVVLMVVGLGVSASADLLFSQYVDTDSGNHPKGIELWNSSDTTIDFSVDNLLVEKGQNGGAASDAFSLSSGMLAADTVMVIGSDESGDPLYDYMADNYPAVSYYQDGSFNQNGNDAFQVSLGGVLQDMFGVMGSDPGTEWSGNGVSTADQNIQLKKGITGGDTDGWTDPSTRFETVVTNPSGGGSELNGFGVAPIPEPATFSLVALLGIAALLWRRLLSRK